MTCFLAAHVDLITPCKMMWGLMQSPSTPTQLPYRSVLGASTPSLSTLSLTVFELKVENPNKPSYYFLWTGSPSCSHVAVVPLLHGTSNRLVCGCDGATALRFQHKVELPVPLLYQAGNCRTWPESLRLRIRLECILDRVSFIRPISSGTAAHHPKQVMQLEAL